MHRFQGDSRYQFPRETISAEFWAIKTLPRKCKSLSAPLTSVCQGTIAPQCPASASHQLCPLARFGQGINAPRNLSVTYDMRIAFKGIRRYQEATPSKRKSLTAPSTSIWIRIQMRQDVKISLTINPSELLLRSSETSKPCLVSASHQLRLRGGFVPVRAWIRSRWGTTCHLILSGRAEEPSWNHAWAEQPLQSLFSRQMSNKLSSSALYPRPHRDGNMDVVPKRQHAFECK
jgi:hypothetical protein